MNSKFTPGPWKLNPKKATYEVVLPKNATLDDQVRLERLQALGLVQSECLSIGTNHNQVAIIPLDESSIANANLISAAPDLLEALQNLVRLCECEYAGSHQTPAVIYAKAAIAKALGEHG